MKPFRAISARSCPVVSWAARVPDAMLPCMRDVVRFTVPEFLSPGECARWIAETHARGYEEAPITTSRGFVFDSDVRNNTRVIVDDRDATDALWTRLAPYVTAHNPTSGMWVPIGLNERLRFYRYEAGQAFRWHYDGAFMRGPGEVSRLTFLVYLNDGFEGGETEFEDALITPQKGTALLFSHAVRHQGAPVKHGVKYALRSDVMFRLQPRRSV